MMDNYHFGWHIGMSLVWLTYLIVVLYLIYELIEQEKIFAPSRPVAKSGENILAERYAKGEQTSARGTSGKSLSYNFCRFDAIRFSNVWRYEPNRIFLQ